MITNERNMTGVRYMRPVSKPTWQGMTIYILGLLAILALLGVWVEYGYSINPNIPH